MAPLVASCLDRLATNHRLAMLRIGRLHMRFVLVNGRTPCPKTFCMFCCEPIHRSYLREFSTGLPFCDHDCYALYSCRWMSKMTQTKRPAAIEDYC